MHINFLKNLEDETKRLMKELGFIVPSFEELRLNDKRDEILKNKIPYYDLKNLLLHFLTVNCRRIPVIKRTVHLSENLKNNKNISEVVGAIQNGYDFNKLQSYKLTKSDQSKDLDLLNTELEIYQLELKESRNGGALLIYLNGEDAYLIDILMDENYGELKLHSSSTKLIQIMYDNWPDLIKPNAFKKGSYDASIIVNDGSENQHLSAACTADKTSFSAAIKCDQLFSTANYLQALVEANCGKIKEMLLTHTINPSIKLILREDLNFLLVESDTNTLINIVEN